MPRYDWLVGFYMLNVHSFDREQCKCRCENFNYYTIETAVIYCASIIPNIAKIRAAL